MIEENLNDRVEMSLSYIEIVLVTVIYGLPKGKEGSLFIITN